MTLSKNAKIVFIASVALAALVVVFALLNRSYVEPRREAQRTGVFYFLADGERHAVSREDIESLSPFAIDANYKTSGMPAQNKTYRGVSLRAIAESLGIDISAYGSVLFTAADGYASVLSAGDALDSGNCYIVIEEGGLPLGTLEDGGVGPFMMILAHDAFSLRWCKYLLEVSLR